jgi:hypothetical protein
MPTPTYTPLATVTLSTTPTSLTFSSLPATYRDLVLVITAAASSGQQFNFRLNGDTGSNYSYVLASGFASTTESFAETVAYGRFGNVATTTGIYSINIMDYSATDKHKTIISRSGDATASNVSMFANRWANTAAITTIQLFPGSGGSFTSGSRFDLYGISA